MKTSNLINQKNVVEWRNHLHQYPEMSFQEYKTSQYIFDVLTSFGGLEVTRPTETSVVAVLDTKKPGKFVGFRADIDALPMQETLDDLPYKSKVDGMMHSCGHDTHVAMLLGAAEAAVKLSNEGKLKGKIKFIFQHAEEVPPGGAKDLVEAGVVDDIDEIYALHITGGAANPLGRLEAKTGYASSACDTITLKLKGLGSHGSTPEKSIDLVSVGAQIVNSLQTIVSRNIAATETAVLTIGSFNIGTANNIIADEGEITGTIRTFKPEIRELVSKRVEKIIKGICEANDVEYDLEIFRGYSSIKVSEEQFEVMKNAAQKIEGIDFHVAEPLMGSEDFSAYTEKVPGAFAFLGGGGDFYNHHPHFYVSEEGLLLGSTVHLQIILDLLGE